MLYSVFRLNAVLVLILFLGGCTSWKIFLTEPKANLEYVNLAQVSDGGVTLLFGVGVENPNSFSMTVKNVNYELEMNSRPFAKGEVSNPVTIPAKGKGVVEIPVPLRFTDLLSSLASFLQSGKTPYLLKGSAQVGPFTIPFKKQDEIKLR